MLADDEDVVADDDDVVVVVVACDIATACQLSSSRTDRMKEPDP